MGNIAQGRQTRYHRAICLAIKLIILMHRFGRRIVALVGNGAIFVLLLIISFSWNYWFYLTFLFLAGIPKIIVYLDCLIWGKQIAKTF